MWIRILQAALLLSASLHAQGVPSGFVGWYNGNWKSGIPGQSNWYLSASEFDRVYDDFVVPDGGWTVVSVFAHNTRYGPGGNYDRYLPGLATEAFWEIRSGMSENNGGSLIASGRSPAKETCGLASGTSLNLCRIQVDSLAVNLAPGRYWLSVAPVVGIGESYLALTQGAAAVGEPQGNDGQALYSKSLASFHAFTNTGSGGTSGDGSLGMLVSPIPVSPAVGWQNNISYLVQQMPRMHSLPYPGISLADFNARAAELSARVPSLSDPEIRTGFQSLVASINDPHTYIGWPSPTPFRYLPLTFYWFDEGIYVTAAPAPYGTLLGGRLVSIGNVGIDEAIQRLTPLVPHDNDQWLKATIPGNIITNTDFLLGVGIADSNGGAQVQVEMPSGVVITTNVSAGSAGPKTDVFRGSLPLYRQHPDRNYWATPVQDGATVYFQYNSCQQDPKQALDDFLAQVDAMLAKDGAQRLIVDMRNNSGGFAILDPWIRNIAASRFNHPNRLYVIVGRATFSAAMQATDIFKDNTSATFVGEPTGAKPRFLLHVGDFSLPYFGLRVTYSNGVEQAKDFGDALIPDIPTRVTFEDYMHGADPALDAILNIPLPDR